MKTAMRLLTLLALVTSLNVNADRADLTYREPTPGTPSTVNWCASLLSNQGLRRLQLNELGIRLRGLMARAGELFADRDNFDFQSTLARISVDFVRSKDQHFAVNQILVGEDAIRENLRAVAAEAAQRDVDYDPAAARRTFPTERRTMAHASRALLMTAVTGGIFTFANYLYLHDQPWGAGIASLGIVYTVAYYVVPPLRALFHQLVNKAIIVNETGERPGPIARAGRAVDSRGPRFADAVLAALGEGGDPRRPIFTRYAVALPISLSMSPLAYAERSAPTADEITAALRTSGDFGLPQDHRRLIASHVYYYDEVEGQTVMITTVVERRAPTDWK